MPEPDFQSASFREAELRSERTRVKVLLGVLASLLVLILIRAGVSLAQGHTGQAWPFALALGLTAAYEAAWLVFLGRAITFGASISRPRWIGSILVESLLPTAVVLLQVHTPLIGPQRALASPVLLVYLLFTILSALHLDPSLPRMAGGFAAAGYSLVAIYTFLRFPEAAGNEKLLAYATAFSCAVLLCLGGFAAGAVAGQIRLSVVAAIQEAAARAKIAHDLSIANSIQQGLLPKDPPQVEGFDIAGWNRPADETGGDYFDWQQLPEGQVAFTIADVTGHGIGPALCMSTCRAYARAGFTEERDLQDFLCSLNEFLYQDLPPEKFVTMAVGLLDPDEASLELISAGHGPLLHYLSAEDRFRSYDAQGLPLGLIPNLNYSRPQVLKFAPGDILVLVTDGFIEWANKDDEEFGQRRLTEVIRANRSMPAAKIISELYAAVSRFAGREPQFDDLTALIVKRI